MNKITGTTKVWLIGDYYGPEEIKRDGSKAVGNLQYTSSNMTNAGWICIGTAEITVTLVSDNEIVENKVNSLRSEITGIRAKAEMQETALEAKIQQLLAITNEVAA